MKKATQEFLQRKMEGKELQPALSEEAGEEMDENLSKAEAAKKIDELQRKTGRGLKEK